jgi:hypothetical protein
LAFALRLLEVLLHGREPGFPRGLALIQRIEQKTSIVEIQTARAADSSAAQRECIFGVAASP